ncbi:ATP-binding protein [Sphaerisporangium melleum]|uniref:ATP-binding protein n=2 Tax=Sphaerisporangium melleum TaxID=321316 RepID=A0A917R3C2_9ACTN|nr:ATP-binding protein [Sphaerisporangium melleum]GII71507.1 ATP-binding protein [Sphaerisporangium melleum]
MGNLLGVIELAGIPESASVAREFVRQKLGAGHPALDDVTLLVSEAVTNSVVHSDSRNGGKVRLAIADCHDLIHVDVVDAGGDTVPHVRGDLYAEGGRGLMLVETLSHRWDVYEDAGGRTLWFQVRYTRPLK